MKTKKVLSFGLSFCFYLGSSAYANNLAFNQDDVQKFNATNACVDCDLSNASLYGNHSQANLSGANLSNASGSYINLSQANLQTANLTNATFNAANFSEADFTGAGVYQADFGSANLYKAKITPEQLSQVKSLCNATLPDGSKGSCS